MPLHLHNVFPPIGRRGSALWEINELPGVILHCYPSTSDHPGWRMDYWDDEITSQAQWVLEQLRNQVFPTRREIMRAIEAALELYPGDQGEQA